MNARECRPVHRCSPRAVDGRLATVTALRRWWSARRTTPCVAMVIPDRRTGVAEGPQGVGCQDARSREADSAGPTIRVEVWVQTHTLPAARATAGDHRNAREIPIGSLRRDADRRCQPSAGRLIGGRPGTSTEHSQAQPHGRKGTSAAPGDDGRRPPLGFCPIATGHGTGPSASAPARLPGPGLRCCRRRTSARRRRQPGVGLGTGPDVRANSGTGPRGYRPPVTVQGDPTTADRAAVVPRSAAGRICASGCPGPAATGSSARNRGTANRDAHLDLVVLGFAGLRHFKVTTPNHRERRRQAGLARHMAVRGRTGDAQTPPATRQLGDLPQCDVNMDPPSWWDVLVGLCWCDRVVD